MIKILISLLIISLRFNSSAASPDDFHHLQQGWTVSEAEYSYHWNFGSQLMPARWFLSLEMYNSTNLLSHNLDRFGFIVRGNGIPVGVTFDESEITAHLYKEKKWVGVNCTACHTSLMEVKGKKILINGNQSQLKLQEFEESIIKSIEVTLTDSAKLQRFAELLGEKDLGDLSKRLLLFRNEFKEWYSRNHIYHDLSGEEVRWGPGRIDGLGGSTNDLTCKLTPRMGANPLSEKIFVNNFNCGASHAPVSLPHLWGMTNQNAVQWNGEVHASLGRNVGAMMAGYGKNWVESAILGLPKVKTTIKISDVYKVENLYKKLKAPTWNEMVELQLGSELEKNKMARGEVLYKQNCLACHAIQPKLTPPNRYGNRYWDFPLIPVSEVGTDPFYTIDEINHRTKINPLLMPIFISLFGVSNIDLKGQVPPYAARGILPGAAIKNYFVEEKISPEGQEYMNNCRSEKLPARIDVIKAKSLEGILFTAPYLHNGSVPTIYSLLMPPKDRPGKFYVGCAKYDIENFGYDCGPKDVNSFEFDTSLQGNSNSGHDYGTYLTKSEKEDLVEFIKSLQQPEYISGNPECN